MEEKLTLDQIDQAEVELNAIPLDDTIPNMKEFLTQGVHDIRMKKLYNMLENHGKELLIACFAWDIGRMKSDKLRQMIRAYKAILIRVGEANEQGTQVELELQPVETET